MINGSVPGCPKLQVGIVDVRDVALLHIKAMTSPKAKNERFLALSGFMWTSELAATLRERLGNKGRKVPTRGLPGFLLKFMAFFDSGIALVAPELGNEKSATNEKARTLLDWSPIPPADSLVATAESLINLGIVKV